MRSLEARLKGRTSFVLAANDDRAKRSPDIRWPAAFTPASADLYAHNERFIRASCSRVWRHLVEAPKWPAWYPNAHDVRIITGRPDSLQSNSRFQFDSFGLHLDGRIREFLPESRLGWYGLGPDIAAYQAWLLIESSGGCQVVTEKVANGPAAVALRRADPDALYRGHDLWLSTLKMVAEG